MNLTVQKRYCYRQSRSLSEAIHKIETQQEKHPDSKILLEFNERSSWTKYRVVRITPTEVEVPDEPKMEDFGIPEYPQAEKLPDENVLVEFEKNGGIYGGVNRCKMTHLPSGTEQEGRVWNTDGYEVRGIREALEQRLDPTYEERLKAYKTARGRYTDAHNAWEKEIGSQISGEE